MKALAVEGWDVWSAGSAPSGMVHPRAAALLAEVGIALEGQWSKGLDAVPSRTWDYVVTMGCGEACPAVPARHRLDWDLPDPAALTSEEARQVRDDLLRRVRQLAVAPRD